MLVNRFTIAVIVVMSVSIACGGTNLITPSSAVSSSVTPQPNSLGNSGTAELCRDYNYQEDKPSAGSGLTILVDGGVLRESPSFTAKIVKVLPNQDVNAPYVDGPMCSNYPQSPCSNIDHVFWYEVNVDGIVGWHSDCQP